MSKQHTSIQTVFKQFNQALCALLDHPDTPPYVRDQFEEAIDECVNKTGLPRDARTLTRNLAHSFAGHLRLSESD